MIQVGFVDIQVHHAGIRTADLGNVRITEAAAHLSRAAPVLNLSLYFGVSALNDAGDHGMALAGTLKVGHHLAHSTAGIEFTQPGRRIRGGILGGALFLHIDQHDRDIQVTDGRKHIIRGCIRQKLKNDQVHVCSAELVAGRHGQFFGGHNPAVDQFDRIRNPRLEIRILALKLGNQGWELGQISTQCNGKYTDPCFCVD